jgi:hypothetical protein
MKVNGSSRSAVISSLGLLRNTHRDLRLSRLEMNTSKGNRRDDTGETTDRSLIRWSAALR